MIADIKRNVNTKIEKGGIILEKKKTYQTIREVAQSGLISEHYLRKMVCKGDCPGFYSGNRFLVNVDKLVQKLDKQCGEVIYQ